MAHYKNATTLAERGSFLRPARSVLEDLLRPLLFCSPTRNLCKSLQSPFNVWYLDDATLGGDFELVRRDFQTIVEIGASLGLELNTSKCDFVVCGGTPTQQQVTRQKMKLLCPGVIFPDKETLTLLGAPVFPEAIPPVLEKKIQQAELMTTRLEEISAHQALFLLKNCLSLPKLLYIFRCSPTFSCLPSLQAFDETIRKCAGEIANIVMDDTVWRQSSIPVSRDGFGIRRVDELALPAFLASVHSAFDLVKQIYPQVDANETYLRGSAGQLGYAANKAEKLKRHKYRELDGRYLFCPVAFETFGPFRNEASSLIQQIGKRIAEATGEARSLSFLKQKLSIDIQRGNAACFRNLF
ncbi:hypothetical protein RvY_19063 [Ramazzottius varieornatus]|uniref:Reverse transcriptase domain-containing protein n=1 Tax=Ramazzottius varieornatus TaxID=947166 RepID=A0A1D1WAH5_RAMVA|nr:hypothetical protein RvY_19063 [Ramazzottius varieornatus]